MAASVEVGLGQIQENEKISNALITSIYAGHLMYSCAPHEQTIREFTGRIESIPQSNPPAAVASSPATVRRK